MLKTHPSFTFSKSSDEKPGFFYLALETCRKLWKMCGSLFAVLLAVLLPHRQLGDETAPMCGIPTHHTHSAVGERLSFVNLF